MIDPNSINPLNLPSLPLTNRRSLPELPCIYFAVDAQDQIQYIGRSTNLRRRWFDHHRKYKLQESGSIRIAWLEISDISLLPAIEKALIEWFNPPLNGFREIIHTKTVSTGVVWRLNELMAVHRIKGIDLARALNISNNSVSSLRKAKTMPRMDGYQLSFLLNTLGKLSRNKEAKITLSSLIEYFPCDTEEDDVPFAHTKRNRADKHP